MLCKFRLCVEMNIYIEILLACAIFKSSVSLDEHLWHSYQFSASHQNREELFIRNVTSDDDFKVEYKVKEWKTVQIEKATFALGLVENENKIAVVSIKLDSAKRKFNKTSSFSLDLDTNIYDFVLFEHWNVTLKQSEVVVVVATKGHQLRWYKVEENKATQFWNWNLKKNITHLNFFEIDHNYHLLVVTQYLTQTSADLYEFQLGKRHNNFWLRQKISLEEPIISSSLSVFGPDYFLSIPQESLQIYKLSNNHFIPYANITSQGLTRVVSFTTNHKSFLAINGFNAGIYRFTSKNGLKRENGREMNLEGVQYWLPIRVPEIDEIFLVAQLSLDYGLHKSFIIKILTYNGVKFEEHEDVRCLYFGEEILGLSCLPGEESDEGIVGAAPISLGAVLGVLIPRHGDFSELFMFQSEKRKIPSPVVKELEDLIERRKYLQAILDSQEETMNKIKNASVEGEIIANPRESLDLESVNIELEQMETDVKDVREKMRQIKAHEEHPHYKKIIFNGPVEISAGIFREMTVEKIRDKPADEVLGDIFLKNSNDSKITGAKKFSDLRVKNITFAQLNDVDASDIVFEDSNEKLVIEGDLILQKPLTVTRSAEVGKVNGLEFEKEVIELDKPIADFLAFENIEVLGSLNVDSIQKVRVKRQEFDEDIDWENTEFENLVISGNINVGNVNGENFEELLQQLCMRNIRTYIPGITEIEGDVYVKGDLKTEFINDLRFPLEYVFPDNSFPNITGKKTFTETLTVSEVYSEGTVNGIDTTEVVTLSTDQEIEGLIIFNELEVGESLTVDGEIKGKHPSKFLSNPTLLETDFVKSNVNFFNLEVEGDIILEDSFNGQHFESLLADKIYNDQEEVVISSVKQFPEGFVVRENLEIKSNSINNIDLDSLVTKDAEQVLNITTINGIADFHSLEIHGLYNGFDVKNVDENIAKLDGQQYISSTLIFEDELEINSLEVIESIDNLTENQFSHSDNQETEFEFDDRFDFVEIEGNFVGRIEGFDIEDFDKRRMSLSKDQKIAGNYVVDKLFTGHLDTVQVNDINYSEFDEELLIHQIKKKLKEGKIEVKNIYVNGSLDVDTVNGVHAYNIGNTMLKGSAKKFNLTDIYVNDVVFDDLRIQNLSGVGFQRFYDLLVFKDDTDIKVAGDKTFLEGFTVEKLIETKELNGVPVDKILTKYGKQDIEGPITFKGNVSFVEELEVERLNGVNVDFIKKNFEIYENQCVVKGDILFSRMPHINNLQIHGSVDDNPQTAQQFLDSLIYKDADFKLTGKTIFENKVNILGNLRVVDLINGVNLPAFVSNMVFTTKDSHINSPVKFSAPVTVTEQFNINGNLKTQLVNNISLESWMEKAVFVNRGLLKGDFIFDQVELKDNLHAKFINDIDVDTLIPLRTRQNLTDMSFGQVRCFSDIKVGNSTNFYDLQEEYSNTLLVNSKQEINSDIVFSEDVFVDGNVELFGFLNGRDTKKIVTTNTDQTLTAIYNFKSKITIDRNLEVSGLVNGINMTVWVEDGVKLLSSDIQTIENSWKIQNNLIFEDDLNGNSLINGIDLHELKNDIEQRLSFKYMTEKGFIQDYLNMCKDLTYMHEKMKKQIYRFDYFENLQMFQFEDDVQYVHTFKYHNNFYVLIGEANSCESYLLSFINSHFEVMSFVPFGQVTQIISVNINNQLFMVVKTEDFGNICKNQGTAIWKFTPETFVNVLVMEDQDLLQESLVPGTFYGIKHHTVTEFKILPEPLMDLQKYRKWDIREDNMAFVPRGLATGLALRTGSKLIRLNRVDPIIEVDSDLDTEAIILSNKTEESNTFLPGLKDSDTVVLRVGVKSSKRSLLAVASHEETSVRGNLDFIKIYEDVISGRMFQKISCYKPSSLTGLEFGNGETFLMFLENESVLKVFEYKGIEGFRKKISAKLEGSKLFSMIIPLSPFKTEKRLIGLINKNRVNFMEAIMLGNRVEEDLKCSL